MTHSPELRQAACPGGSGSLLVLAIVAAAAALWFFYLRPTDSSTAGEEFIGTWAPEAGTGGGLVIAQTDGDQFKITQYDGQLQRAGSTTADLVDDALAAERAGLGAGHDRRDRHGAGDADARERERQPEAPVHVGRPAARPRHLRARRRPACPRRPSPTPSPTPSPSPTATTSPTASPSPSTSGSPSADQQVIDGIAKLQVGIVTWASANNNLYPPPQDVVEGGGISQYVDPWPTNPFTGQPMTPGTAPGSYVYEQLDRRPELQAHRLPEQRPHLLRPVMEE